MYILNPVFAKKAAPLNPQLMTQVLPKPSDFFIDCFRDSRFIYKFSRPQSDGFYQIEKSLDGFDWSLHFNTTIAKAGGDGIFGFDHQGRMMRSVWQADATGIFTVYLSDDNGMTFTSHDCHLTSAAGKDMRPHGPIHVHNGRTYFMAYQRNKLVAEDDGVWRKTFLISTTDWENYDIRCIVDYAGATPIPTAISSLSAFIDEIHFVVHDGYYYIAQRNVGEAGSAYNRGFTLFKVPVDLPEDFTPITYAEIASGSMRGYFVNCASFTEGGHIRGVLPRIGIMSNGSELYMCLAVYNRNFSIGNEDSSLYFQAKPLSQVLASGFDVFVSFDSSKLKIGETLLTNNSNSPQGGNMGISYVNGDWLIVCPNDRRQSNQYIRVKPKYLNRF